MVNIFGMHHLHHHPFLIKIGQLIFHHQKFQSPTKNQPLIPKCCHHTKLFTFFALQVHMDSIRKFNCITHFFCMSISQQTENHAEKTLYQITKPGSYEFT